MNIGLVGFGYWGRILYKNLKTSYTKITVYDPVATEPFVTKNLEDLYSCTDVFIAVPCFYHYDLCKNFLARGINVFCEKPLTITFEQAKDLYALAETTNTLLFVDWLFTFNEQVNYIKQLVATNELGKLKSISMKRLNKGPVRVDVNCFYDLASHDVSVLLHILGLDSTFKSVKTNHYRMNPLSQTHDSFFGIFIVKDVSCTIETSWEHPVKNRDCYFVFEKATVYWNDINQEIIIDGSKVYPITQQQPLKLSIDAFLKDRHNNKDITLKIAEILDDNKI